MSTHRTQVVVVSSVLASLACLAGCSSSGEPTDPHDQLAAVKSALAAPSGTVDATSMRDVSKLYASMTDASAVLGSISVIGSQKAQACLQGSHSSGAYDLACATSGQLSGQLSFEVDGAVSAGQAQATYVAKFENACSGSTCVTGSVIVEATVAQSSVDTTVAFSADVTKNGQKTHLYFGEQATVSNGSATAKVVVFDGHDDSYVVDASVGAAGASYSVSGANGAFQCSLSAAGGGQCSGSASFSY